MSKRRKEMNEPIKPKDCFECISFGKNGEHLKSGKAHFPSLCEKDLLFFQCGGKEGIKKGEKIKDVKKKKGSDLRNV